MKRVRINVATIGLIIKNGEIQRVITKGAYWIDFGASVTVYDLRSWLRDDNLMDQMKANAEFAQHLHFVDVADNEIVLRFENGLFKEVMSVGQYAFWKGLIDYRFQTINLDEMEIDQSISMSVLKKSQVAAYVRAVEIDAFEKGLLYKNGSFYKELVGGSYYFWKNADTLFLKKADLRQLQMEISGQEILTKDKAALRINYNLRYVIADAKLALVETKDYEKQLYTLCQLALREYIGSMTLDEMLANKESVSDYVQAYLSQDCETMGIAVKTSGIKDVILNGEMKEIMNQVLIAEKRAQANTIMRREETASTRSLLNTAKLMEDNSMLFKLKEMEYVEKIAERINNISISGGDKVVDQMRQLFGS